LVGYVFVLFFSCCFLFSLLFSRMAFVLLFASLCLQLSVSLPSVTLPSGAVVTGNSDGSFLGIPYGTIPQRWTDAVPHSLSSPFNATEYGPFCPQTPDIFFNNTYTPQDENCLSLNVFVKGNGPARPVMVWIHGGGFQFGGSRLYPGNELAAGGDVVVVTLNYRLGILAQFALPGQKKGFNFHLSDQKLALQWVQENVAAFGGDPSRVTLFGESAGGASVLFHSQNASGLFSQAIAQSAGPWLSFSPQLMGVISNGIAKGFNCSSIECMRLIPFKYLNAFEFSPLPVADGNLVPACPPGNPFSPCYPLLSADSSVPLMIGTTGAEGVIYPYSLSKWTFGSAFTEADQMTVMAGLFPNETVAAELLSWYPGLDPFDQVAALMGDYQAYCGTERVSATATYRYVFNTSTVDWIFGVPNQCGATHSAELPYLFNMSYGLHVNLSAEESAFSAVVRKTWLSFAISGDPGFRAYNPKDSSSIALFSPQYTLTHLPANYTDLWFACDKWEAYFNHTLNLSL
jgi:para-nitrobenzyl esterase